jgi:PAS domain S-box-containing protein
MDAKRSTAKRIKADRHLPLLGLVALSIASCVFAATATDRPVSFAAALIGCLGLVCAGVSWAIARQNRQHSHERDADLAWEQAETEATYGRLIDALGDLVIHRDQSGKILFANSAFVTLTGRPSAEIIGRTFTELGVAVETEESTGGDSEIIILEHRKERRWYQWTTIAIRNPAHPQLVRQSIGRDVTVSRQATLALHDARQKAEQASAAKSRFLATVSHEIRTPLNGITGMAKLMADSGLTPEQRTYNEAISTSGSALLALIENLLDFSVIEAGRFKPEYSTINPRELVEQVVELVALRAYEKDIGLGCSIAPDVPAAVTTDAGRLRQVLINLIGNAIKFTDIGGVHVDVSLSGGQLGIEVRDSGQGIEPADQRRIFGEFEQADGSTTRRHGGAGLGLAISRSIVDALGGELALVSSGPDGSVFQLALPLGVEPKLDVSHDAAKAALAGLSIAIVSANQAETAALVSVIASHGGTAVTAVSGGEADIALILPNGADDTKSMAARAKVRFGPQTRCILLIEPYQRDRLASLHADGFDAFLARPVRRDSLVRLLAGQMDASSQTMQATPVVLARPAGPGQTRVLIAEDNPVNALLARTALVRAGFTVEVVGDGQQAVDRATSATQRPDLVLMDLHMPVMDGVEAIVAIRRHERSCNLPALPIYALTADGQDETRQMVLDHGATGFLTKPVDPHSLARIAQQAQAA